MDNGKFYVIAFVIIVALVVPLGALSNRIKDKIYVIAFVSAVTLVVPLGALSDRLSVNGTYLFYGVLIGFALAFLAAATRIFKRSPA